MQLNDGEIIETFTVTALVGNTSSSFNNNQYVTTALTNQGRLIQRDGDRGTWIDITPTNAE